jgi:5-carboxymethyl-2-hydroxymuconate isomerase
MPHVTLECSANVIEDNYEKILLEIHHILADMLPTQLESCKGRIIEHKHYVVGNGDKKNAFVHLSVQTIPGRSDEVINSAAYAVLEYLKGSFAESFSKRNLQISVAIDNLPKAYLKYKK